MRDDEEGSAEGEAPAAAEELLFLSQNLVENGIDHWPYAQVCIVDFLDAFRGGAFSGAAGIEQPANGHQGEKAGHEGAEVFDLEAGACDGFGEAARGVASNMVRDFIGVAPECGVRRDGKDQPAARSKHFREVNEDIDIIFNMFEHVEQADKVEVAAKGRAMEVGLEQRSGGAAASRREAFGKQVHAEEAATRQLGEIAQYVSRTTANFEYVGRVRVG